MHGPLIMIVIFGASGKVGGTAAGELVRRGRRVRAVVRAPSKGAGLALLGCDVALADLHDGASLTSALRGAEAVLAICPPRVAADDVLADADAMMEALGAALERARPKRVVAISDYAAQHPEGTGVTLVLHRLERRLRGLAGTTFLRSAEQMQNWLRHTTAARVRGELPSLHHPVTRAFPTVSAFDVGKEAADLLDAPAEGGPSPRVVHLEGPRRYCAEEFARVFQKALGRQVVARAVDRADWATALAAGGLGANYARLVMELQDAHNAGRIDVEADVGEVRHGATELEEALAPALGQPRATP
jgi:uncharacterized protein YbjT (DUF2867 family)